MGDRTARGVGRRPMAAAGALGLLLAATVGGCSFDWDALDPALSVGGGTPTGAGGQSTSMGGSAGAAGDAGSGAGVGGSGGCTGALIDCNGSCIDPDTDPNHCGASGDCQGANAGEQCAPTAPCTGGSCAETCDNCGFETGDFTSWDMADLADPYYALSVGPAGEESGSSGFFVSAPTEGTFAALHGFDGSPGTIELGQDITLNPVPSATLRFDYRGAWWIFNYLPTQDRTFHVHIEPAGGGAPLHSELILTAAVFEHIYDTGDLAGTVDLSAYAGQQVYMHFVWTVPENWTGPGFFQLDNIRVTSP